MSREEKVSHHWRAGDIVLVMSLEYAPGVVTVSTSARMETVPVRIMAYPYPVVMVPAAELDLMMRHD